MSDCYTPTDGEVLEAWAAHNTPDLPTALDLVGAYDAFKRWLAEHDAKVRAEAIRSARDKLGVDISDEDSEWWQGYRQGQRRQFAVLTEYADRIEREAQEVRRG